ncbi:hypothetical protein [Paenibacillus taiwanensis]|uniref:hypothetical protein n=1 Tax=Paenibacillus taiwanensis TaxID=401638 RepID=UPI00041843AE|nr:hypothetical protein [Paenibacillus taiwanensis]
MVKQSYYVSIQHRTIQAEPVETSHWEILATKEEVEHMSYLLGEIGDAETDVLREGFMMFTPQTNEALNARYQVNLNAVYSEIYRLGTEHTKAEIKRMWK